MENSPVTITEPAAVAALKEIYENNGPGKLEWDFRAPGQVTGRDNRLEEEDGALTGLNLDTAQLKGILKLRGVETLTVLSARGNGLYGVELEDLPGLETLYLEDNQISDVQTLAKLPGLEALSLSDNRIDDIGPLAQLTGLERLDLAGNEGLTDLAPMAGLAALQQLQLGAIQRLDLAPLAKLKALQLLTLPKDWLGDFAPLAPRLKKLRFLSFLYRWPRKARPGGQASSG